MYTKPGQSSQVYTKLSDMAAECTTIKQLHKAQKAVVKFTSTKSREEAEEKWPECGTFSQLEVFKKLNFSGSVLPEPFSNFYQRAIAIRSLDDCTEEPQLKEESDNLFY